jgi:homoserine dehydrogenase
MNQIKTALLGLGNVNIGLIKILQKKRHLIAENHGLEFIITAVSDSTGVAVNGKGFSYEELIALKAVKGKVNQLNEYLPGISSENLPDYADASLLIESSPVNLLHGNPGLTATRRALEKGWKVVLANKAPVVFAFDELHDLAKKNHSKLAFSSTVCGGLPVINVLKRDMACASLHSFHGILNATTNHILNALENGGTMDDAIKEAQRVGAAEADPMHDVKGHDAANKLYIITKSFTDFRGSIHDIETTGIQNLTSTQLEEARKRGNKIKLIASAIPDGQTWKLSVKPTEVTEGSFLGQCNGWEMGIQFESDLYESISMKIFEEDPLATSAAVLRDMLTVLA